MTIIVAYGPVLMAGGHGLGAWATSVVPGEHQRREVKVKPPKKRKGSAAAPRVKLTNSVNEHAVVVVKAGVHYSKVITWSENTAKKAAETCAQALRDHGETVSVVYVPRVNIIPLDLSTATSAPPETDSRSKNEGSAG